MDAVNKSIGIIVLAAGASSRMHEPKQLLQFEGKTLLRRAVETAIATGCKPVVVVLGANFNRMLAEISDLRVDVCHNTDWRKGLSSSLKCGLENLLNLNPEIDAFIATLADQPFVSEANLLELKNKFLESKKPIVAARYNGIVGVPALFAKRIFKEFAQISGDKGAKTIIEKHRKSLVTLDLPEAAIDIDTNDDYVNLQTEDLF
ncbi:MAG: nucleotidyltransferase family protein [Pyrinomonadaceae bacterium]|nr:nucleotidyltransferase family protein [Pyrinomonadaceae bacterium]